MKIDSDIVEQGTRIVDTIPLSCPNCSCPSLYSGYGLAGGGGIGQYAACDECGILFKVLDEDEQETDGNASGDTD